MTTRTRTRTTAPGTRDRRPQGVTEREAFLLVERTARDLRKQVADALKPAGISTAKYNVLRILRDAGRPGLACSVVSERLVEHDPDITRLLDRLEANGWVERARDTEDRRVVKVRITTKGLTLLAGLDDRVAELHTKQFAPLARDDVGVLVSLLERLRAPLQ